MSRCVKNADGEMEVKTGRRTRSIINSETVDSPLRRSSRVKHAGKQNESSPESPPSDNSNINSTPSVRNTRRRIDALNNSALSERSRTLRSRRNSGLDEQTSKQHTRAGSESKSPPTAARPTRRTRASSMEPAANIDKNQMKTNNSELVHTPINTRKRRSILPAGKPVIEENEEIMNPVVALDRVLPNLQEINETCSESFTTEDVNKSVPVSKNEVDTVLEDTCKEETDADINARKENTNPAENSPIKAVEEVKMDTSINKLIVSDNSESINDSINTTQVESPIEDVTKTQAQKEEVTPRKLGMKNGSYANNSIKEDDEILGNKENQEANIIDNSKNTDVTISNVLLQSPKLAVSNLCVGKSVKESNENADSSDNMQNVMVTDTDSLSETPLSESMDEKVACIEVCEDSSLDDNIQILKCPEDVNDMKLSQYSDIEDQNTSSADTNVDRNRDEEIGADKSLRLETSMEEQQHITSEDGTINNDKNVGPPLTPKAHTNTHEGDPKDVCLTPIEYASDKCEANEETATSNISKNVTDADIMNCSNSSDISISKTTTSLSLATNDSTKDDSAGIEMITETPSQENVEKESSDVDIKLTDIETTSVVTDKDNITNETENDKSCSDAQSSAESIDKVLEKDDETLNICKLDDSATSERKSITDSDTQNKTEENEIPKMFEKHDEKPEDDNQSDANVSRELFKDISADEWRDKICETNSVHSMSTERLENESENECDDFVLVDKESSQTPENTNIDKEKIALNYDSDDTVTLLKPQRDELKENREESVTVSKVQCEMNKNKLAEVINTRKSMQQEEINEIKSDTNNLEIESQDRKEPMHNQIKDLQNISPRKASTIEVSNQFTPANSTSIEDSVDKNLLTETDQNLNMPSTESSLNKWNSKNKLNDGLSRKSKSVEKLDDEVEKFGEADTVEEKESLNKSPIDSSSSASDSNKSVEKLDDEVEIFSEADTVEEKESLNKSPIESSSSASGSNKSVEKLDDEVEKFCESDTVEEKESLIKSPIDSSSSASDSNKLNESIDSDIEKEYNLHGVDVSKFSYDDVPGDECRASETESSDPDDHGSDLADFVVNDDDDDIDVDNFEDEEDDGNDNSEVEIELSEIDEELCSTQDDDIKESNENTIDEQCPKMQVQEESEKEEIEKEKQKRTNTNAFRKDKHKPTKSKKLDLSKITSNDREITNSEIESSKKKKKRKIKIESSDDEVHEGNEENNERNRKLLSRNLVNANETDKIVVNKQYGKMKVQEIKGKVTKREQEKVGADKKDRVSGIKSTETTEKRSSKFSETRQLDLSESGKNVKRKSEIEIVSKKIKKNKTKNNDERIQKENAIQTYKNESAKCSTVELSRKGVKRLSDDVIGNLSDVPMKVFQKADLKKLPSRLMPHSLLKKNKINVKQGFIPLSSYGSTSNFYVSNIQKMKKAKITSEVLSFRQNMLNRNPRQPISHYTMFLEKQKASNKH